MKIPFALVLSSTFSTVRARQASSTPGCQTAAFYKPRLGPGVKVLSLTAHPRHNYTSAGQKPFYPPISGLNFCQVDVYLTHQTADPADADKVLVEIWLPLEEDDWNGRFQATGGGGYASGMFDAYLAPAVEGGWAAVSTDGGLGRDLAVALNGSWALKPDRTPNWGLLHNLASRSAAEQIVVGKAITAQYFGRKPHHSYWNGCSTGGRQGFAIAQKWPHLLDGILAAAPALSPTSMVAGTLWPQIVMQNEKRWLSECERTFWHEKVLEKCDEEDGVSDGVIEDPEACEFDSRVLVGEKFQCNGTEELFTNEASVILEAIHSGPSRRGYYPVAFGMPLGAPLEAYASSSVNKDGSLGPSPHPLSDSWFKHLILKDPSFDTTSLPYDQYLELFGSGAYEFGSLMNTEDPDLSPLRNSGTKLLSWHGLSDQLVPYQVSLEYRKKVEGVMGGAQAVDNYFRYFLAPGVDHCAGGPGPAPKDPLSALIDWVEHDAPPETLHAETINSKHELVTRDLCAYPAKAKYMGIADPNRASSWSCVGNTERADNDGFDSDGDRAGYSGRAEREDRDDYEASFYRVSETLYHARDNEGEKSAGNNEERNQQGSNGRIQAVLGGLKDRIEQLGLGLRVD